MKANIGSIYIGDGYNIRDILYPVDEFEICCRFDHLNNYLLYELFKWMTILNRLHLSFSRRFYVLKNHFPEVLDQYHEKV